MNILEKLGLVDWCGLTGIGIIVVFGGLLAGVFTTAFAIDAVQCAQYADSTGRETTYKVPAGCYVAFGSRFIPIGEYEKRAITHAE